MKRSYFMENVQYFSFVTNRITELESQLASVQKKLNYVENEYLFQKYSLEKEFLTSKILYLKHFVKLPLYMSLTHLNKEQIKKIAEERKIKETEVKQALIQEFGLEDVAFRVEHPKKVTFGSIKSKIINDFDFMIKLLDVQKEGCHFYQQKEYLQGTDNGSMTFLKLSRLKRHLDKEEQELTLTIESSKDYEFSTIHELRDYLTDQKKHLSQEFIRKHQNKLGNSKQDQKLLKKLQKKRTSWLSKLFPRKRNRMEQRYLDRILTYYRNDQTLQKLDIDIDVLNQSNTQLKCLEKKIEKQAIRKRKDLEKRKHQINDLKKDALKQVQEYQRLEKEKKSEFVDLILTKTDFFPKEFQDQLWTELDLKNSLILESCYQESRQIIQLFEKQFESSPNQELNQISTTNKQYIKKFAA